MASGLIRVRGLREFQRAASRAGKETGREVRGALRTAAEPIRAEAEQLAQSRISHMGSSNWYRMRVGVTRSLVYVAPRQRGRGGSKRPKFGGLLLEKAMQPALEMHIGGVELQVEHALDVIADHFDNH